MRIPLADGTLVHAPSEIPDETLVLMADIVSCPICVSGKGSSKTILTTE